MRERERAQQQQQRDTCSATGGGAARRGCEYEYEHETSGCDESGRGVSTAPAPPPLLAELTDAELTGCSVDHLVERCLLWSRHATSSLCYEPRQLLGVSPSAPRDTCRKRYLALALRLHPDKTSHPRAAEAFRALEAAFRTFER